MAASKLTVRGVSLRTATSRRYVAVVLRAESIVEEDGGVMPAFARVAKRSDSLATIKTQARRLRDNGCRGNGLLVAVVDTLTGEEIA